jgi:hypothetical protein
MQVLEASRAVICMKGSVWKFGAPGRNDFVALTFMQKKAWEAGGRREDIAPRNYARSAALRSSPGQRRAAQS